MLLTQNPTNAYNQVFSCSLARVYIYTFLKPVRRVRLTFNHLSQKLHLIPTNEIFSLSYGLGRSFKVDLQFIVLPNFQLGPVP